MSTEISAKVKNFLKDFDAVVITGASSGIGEGIMKCVAGACGVKIFAVSRSEPELGGINAEFIRADLAVAEQVQSACETVLKKAHSISKFPKILLVNNAGFGGYGPFPEPSLEHNLRMIDLNVRALTALCGAFLPMMAPGSAIVNISSTAAWQPCPQLATYAATKAYVFSFSLGISSELKERGIRCLCVCPGPTSSNFFKAAGFDSPPLPGNFGHKPSDVASATLSALASGKKLVVVGALNKFQTLLAKILPVNLVLGASAAILKRVRSTKP